MEDKADSNSAGENQSSFNESVNKVKTEPLEDQASSSSITIVDNFSIPIDSTNVTVKAENEKEDGTSKPSASGETTSSPPFIKVEIGIKKEPGNDEATGNCSESVTPCDNVVIKKENVANAIKTESDDVSTLPLGDSGQVNPSSDGDTIAKILTTPMPSTLGSASCSTSNCDGTDDVSSSTDPQKPACRYGKNCYRLNENHRKNFSHPPGSDPLKSQKSPDVNTEVDVIEKAKEHRKRFIHDRSPDNAMSNTRKR